MTAPTELHVREFISSWSRHVKSWTQEPNPQLLVLRYEDMLADPQSQFEKVLRLIGAPLDREALTRATGFSSFGALAAQEAEALEALAPLAQPEPTFTASAPTSTIAFAPSRVATLPTIICRSG